jgi:twinkle protein
MQGVPTLWGSFEVSNVRIAKLLMSQYYARSTGKSPVGLVENFDEWADKFETLPLYFMRYFGSNPIERVLHAMEYSNYVHDCSHILLDNLQFLTSGQGRGYDRFEVMDDAIERLRHYATSQNVHVSLVVHPRKENDDQEIQTASIFGTAKATQEADNLIILQRTPHGPVLDVRKNRFDGTLGTLNLRFCSSSRMFEERDAARRNTNALAILQQVARPTNVSVEAKALRSSSARATGRKHTTA